MCWHLFCLLHHAGVLQSLKTVKSLLRSIFLVKLNGVIMEAAEKQFSDGWTCVVASGSAQEEMAPGDLQKQCPLLLPTLPSWKWQASPMHLLPSLEGGVGGNGGSPLLDQSTQE